MTDFEYARTLMAEGQLRPNGITAPAVIAAMQAVKREDFVPPGLRGAAYADGPLDLGHGRALIEPMLLGRMLQEAMIGKADRVLDLGCVTGYTAALASLLAGSVIAVEVAGPLLNKARAALGALANVSLVEGKPAAGHPVEAPYDVILVEGALPAVPPALTAQLAEGGRLVSGLMAAGSRTGELVLLEKIGQAISRRKLCDAWLKPLPGVRADAAFVL